MGDVLVVPNRDSRSIAVISPSKLQQIGSTAVILSDNRSAPRRIFIDRSVVVTVGTPIGDVGSLGRALILGDIDAAKTAVLSLDGHFAIFVVSPDRIYAVTDAAGSIPVYYSASGKTLALGTRVNEVADICAASTDPTSVYDFLIHRGVCHPYTWFSDVFVANPASLIELSSPLKQSYYWTPSEEPRAGLKDLVAAFRTQMRQAAACAADDRVGLLMSAGEDSRAVSSFLTQAHIRGYIFLNNKNREWTFADLVARVMGIPLTLLIRSDIDIAQHLHDRQRTIGYGYDVMQGHVFPFVDRIQEKTLFGGWGSDTLFKGYFLRPPRNKRFSNRGPRGYFEGPAADALRQRYQSQYEHIRPLVPAPAYEWMRIWPLSAHPHFAHFASARRFFDQRELYFHAKTYRISPSIHPRYKYSRQFFYEAKNKPLGIASWLPTSRGTIPALNGKEVDYAKLMIEWSDTRLHPGVGQSSWGTSVQIAASPSYPEIANAVESALAVFDGGHLMEWVRQRSSSLGDGKSDRLISRNRLIQIGLALHHHRGIHAPRF